MNRDDFDYTWTLPVGEPVPVGGRVDVIVDAVEIGAFPKELTGGAGEILMTVAVSSGAETRCWSALKKRVHRGEAAFDPASMAYFVADGLLLDRKGVAVTVELREVDDLDALRKVLGTVSGAAPFLQLIPSVGSTVASVANMGSSLAALLPEDLGKTFFSATQNFNVAGGAAYHEALPGFGRGAVEVRSTGKAPKAFAGSRVRLRVA